MATPSSSRQSATWTFAVRSRMAPFGTSEQVCSESSERRFGSTRPGVAVSLSDASRQNSSHQCGNLLELSCSNRRRPKAREGDRAACKTLLQFGIVERCVAQPRREQVLANRESRKLASAAPVMGIPLGQGPRRLTTLRPVLLRIPIVGGEPRRQIKRLAIISFDQAVRRKIEVTIAKPIGCFFVARANMHDLHRRHKPPSAARPVRVLDSGVQNSVSDFESRPLTRPTQLGERRGNAL